MLAKIYNQSSYRFIDIGNDFNIISENIDMILRKYGVVIENITRNLESKKNKNEKEISETLFRVYLWLFQYDVYSDFVSGIIPENLYEILNGIKTEEELTEKLKCEHIMCKINPSDSYFNSDYNRLTAIKYIDQYGKEVIECFIKKTIYIVNDKGKTVETYRNNG